MPLVALMVIRPLLSKGFAERAFHKETLRGACEAHKRVLKRAEAFSGAPLVAVCVGACECRCPLVAVCVGACECRSLVACKEERDCARFVAGTGVMV